MTAEELVKEILDMIFKNQISPTAKVIIYTYDGEYRKVRIDNTPTASYNHFYIDVK